MNSEELIRIQIKSWLLKAKEAWNKLRYQFPIIPLEEKRKQLERHKHLLNLLIKYFEKKVELKGVYFEKTKRNQ